MDYLSPNSANLTYSKRESSVCRQRGRLALYRVRKINRVFSTSSHSLLLDNSYHDNLAVSKELRIEGNELIRNKTGLKSSSCWWLTV
jgi:hypothetical protein